MRQKHHKTKKEKRYGSVFVLSVKKRRGNYSPLWEWLSEKESCLPKRLPQHRGSHFVFRNSPPERRKSYVDIFKFQARAFLSVFLHSLIFLCDEEQQVWTIIFNFGLVYLETYVHLLEPCYSNYFLDFTIWKRDAIVTELNKLLLGNLRTNREWVILPSSQSKIKKKITLFIDQSTFSNFPLYVINDLIVRLTFWSIIAKELVWENVKNCTLSMFLLCDITHWLK